MRSLILAEAKLCFEEEMALEYAVEELEPLAFLLGRLLDQVCARLAARSLAPAPFGCDSNWMPACRKRILQIEMHEAHGPQKASQRNSYEKL